MTVRPGIKDSHRREDGLCTVNAIKRFHLVPKRRSYHHHVDMPKAITPIRTVLFVAF